MAYEIYQSKFKGSEIDDRLTDVDTLKQEVSKIKTDNISANKIEMSDGSVLPTYLATHKFDIEISETENNALTKKANGYYVKETDLSNYPNKQEVTNEIAAAAYTLPVASSSTLGGVKPDGTTVTVDSDGTLHGASSINSLGDIGNVTISDPVAGHALKYDGEKWINGVIASGSSDYEKLVNKPSIAGVELTGDLSLGDLGIENFKLQKASSTVLGGVKIGEGVSISEDGTISAETGNWLHGKTINFIGDSITYGYYNGGRMTYPYPELVGKILGCTTNNYGINGSTLSSGTNSSNPIVSRLSVIDKNANINVLMAGSNDFGQKKELGEKGSTDLTTVYGALESIASSLLSLMPKSTIVFCSNLHRAEETNGLYTLSDVNTAIKYVAKKYNFQFIDIYNTAPLFRPENSTLNNRWSGDGLHPNQDYVSLIFSQFMASQLLSCNNDIVDNSHSIYVGSTEPEDKGVQLFIDTSRTISSENAISVDYNAGQYSTGEVPVGTWIDGRKIYRKCLDYGIVSGVTNTNQTQFNKSMAGFNVDMIINAYGIFYANEYNGIIPCLYNFTNTFGWIQFQPKNNVLAIGLQGTAFNGCQIYGIVDYVKKS